MRKVGVTTYDTPSDTDVVATRIFNAPRALVFAAWTDCAHLPHWMIGPDGWTMEECQVELKPGGSMRYVWRKGSGEEMTITGICKEVDPPARLVNTESWGGDWPEALNILELTERDGCTTMSMTMRYASKDARDKALGTGMTGGMDLSFDRLDTYCATLAGHAGGPGGGP